MCATPRTSIVGPVQGARQSALSCVLSPVMSVLRLSNCEPSDRKRVTNQPAPLAVGLSARNLDRVLDARLLATGGDRPPRVHQLDVAGPSDQLELVFEPGPAGDERRKLLLELVEPRLHFAALGYEGDLGIVEAE